MMQSARAVRLTLILVFAASAAQAGNHEDGPLPSWKHTSARDAVAVFVEAVTDPRSSRYVPPAARIAVFDNDGTLWSEKPAYFQLLYAIDYVKRNVDEHPEWRDTQPFKAVLDGDMEALTAEGEEGLVKLVMASHAGMTTDEFSASVSDFLSTARHPQKDRLYPELVYQPMLELLDYLRDNGFRTWIVSGGGIDFVRTFAEDAYGIPPEQVVGSGIELGFEMRDGVPIISREPELDFVDDKAGKPVGIHRHIGRRPIAAFGNSDGDLQMLQYTCDGDGPELCVLVRHTDAEREWAYDRNSHIGRLDAALDEADEKGWLVVDMKEDWRIIYPFEREE